MAVLTEGSEDEVLSFVAQKSLDIKLVPALVRESRARASSL